MNKNKEVKYNNYSIFTKTIIIVLVFSFIVNNINIIPFIKAFEKPIEIISEDHSITDTTEFEKVELDEEKTKNSKTYKYDNGINETQIYNNAVHYLDNGNYVNIDNTLIDKEDYYQNNKNSFQVKFPKNISNNIELEYLNHIFKIYYDNLDIVAELDKDIDRNIENLHDSVYYNIDDNISIRYDVLNESIKENVILNNYVENYVYHYYIETDLVMESEEGKLYFYDNDELIIVFDNYLMYDKNYNVSYDIYTDVNRIDDNIYQLNIIPNNEYLLNAEYPVVIDPEIHLTDGGLIDGIVTLFENDRLNNTSTFKTLGYFTINNRNNSISSDDIVADLSIYIPRYYNTNISEILTKNQLMYANLELTTISTNASSQSSAILKYGNNIIDKDTFHNTNIFNHRFNIIDAIGGEIENFIDDDLEFILELSLDGANNTYVNYSLGWDIGGDKPVIIIGYLSDGGLSDYYTYEGFPMNNESSFYVAHNSGNLTYIYSDYNSNNLLSLSHIYNTNRNSSMIGEDVSIYGSGFNINYNVVIEEETNIIKLYEGSGKIVEFISIGNNEYLSKDGTGDKIKKIYNGSTLACYEGEVDDGIYIFNTDGYLESIYLNKSDRVNNSWLSSAKFIDITRTNNIITKVEDSYGNYINFTYSALVNDDPSMDQMGIGYLSKIEVFIYEPNLDDDINVMNIDYEYDTGKLARIFKKYIDNTEDQEDIEHYTSITYNRKNQIIRAERNSKGYNFGYDNRNRIEKVSVYNGSLTNGDYASFLYENSGRETHVTNSKGDITKYSFDNYYHTAKIEDSNNYTTFYRYYDIYGESTINYNLNHKVINESNSFKNISNVVCNHGFEIMVDNYDIYGWTKDVSGTSHACINYTGYLYGSKVLELYKGSGNSKIYQDINVENGKEYIISCFIKNTNSGTGAYLDVVGIDGQVSTTSRTPNIKNTTNFERYEYKFTASFTGKVRLYLVNESSGYSYFDNVNVSDSYIDTRYNYLENSSFEKGTVGWGGYNYEIVDNDYFDSNCLDKCIRLNDHGFISQTINKSVSTGQTFIFGGYARFENYTGKLKVKLVLSNNNTTKMYDYEYVNPVDTAEYYMIKAEIDDEYDNITLLIETYGSNPSSYVWIDNFSLYAENYGINLEYNEDGLITSRENEITDQTTEFEYREENDNDIISVLTESKDTKLTYDSRGNLISIEYNNLSSSFSYDNNDNITLIEASCLNSSIHKTYGDVEYSSDGLYPTKQTNILGIDTFTNYNYLTGLVDSIVYMKNDVEIKREEYEYNAIGQIKSFSEGNGNNTKTVKYSYDNNGNLIKIKIGNTSYTFEYNDYNNIESISINNEELVSYNYDESCLVYRGELLSEDHNYGTVYFEYYDNSLVKSISYGIYKIKEFTYNDYNEIAMITDNMEHITYYYNYDYENRLINVNATNGNNITYSYDSRSRLVSKQNINGASQYTYQDISNNNNNYENDKLTQELINNYGKIEYGYSNDDYCNLDIVSYYLNNSLIFTKEDTREFITKDNQNYYTGRINEIEYTIGNNVIRYEYEYDDFSNITEINGYLNNVLNYTENNYYDVFNQLIAQLITINSTTYLSEYNYDSAGNILGYYTHNYTTSATIHSGTFTYNNKNQMISSYIDGVSYTYTYQNSRITSFNNLNIYYQFNQIGALYNNQTEIIYDYNADGLRIRKNVNGVSTTYLYEGSRIIKETKGNNVINYYYDSNNNIIGFTYNNQKYLYLKNLKNDIIGIIDSNNNIVVQYYYEGYGSILNIVDTSNINLGTINPFRYKSYYYDNETGWYYLNSRYYDPIIKRFITPDDINNVGSKASVLSYNLYAYCMNSPISLADYDGKDAKLIVEFEPLIIVGHMALMVETTKDDWHLMEFSGEHKFDAVIKIYDDESNNRFKKFNREPSIIETILGIFGIGGWLYLRLEGDYSACYEYGKNFSGTNYGGYNLFTNNCLDFVRDCLKHSNKRDSYLYYLFMLSRTCVPVIFFYEVVNVTLKKNRIKVYSEGGGWNEKINHICNYNSFFYIY